MENSFSSVMGQKSNSELLRILTELRNEYKPEAVEAAETEFKKRNLSSNQIFTKRTEILNEDSGQEKKSTENLALHWKIFAFLSPNFLLLPSIFEDEGYETKAQEIKNWTLYGIGFYIAIIILFLIF